MPESEVRKYWLTATYGATVAKEWFTVYHSSQTDSLFGGELDNEAIADGAFQVMRLASPSEDDSMTRNAFAKGEIVLTTDDGKELNRMEAKTYEDWS